MTRFIDDKDQIVADAIDGSLELLDAERYARLGGYPHTRVVMRTDAPVDQVAVISGGGTGHEPAHAGYVGRGMLTAAVAGDLFASPSVDAVLAGILAVNGDAGCLLIVKNYTGDRLNFGLAAERARRMGHDVEMVIIADDIALENAPQPRGIAGTLFAHKVAGYHADNGEPIATVKARVEAVIERVCSIGLALATCDLLTQPPRSQDSQPELGLGIHGEPGAETVDDIDSARDAVDRLVAPLQAALGDGDDRLALLINNLGSVTPMEMDIITRDVLATELGKRCDLVIGPAPMMTSLNMYGFSLSALALTDDIAAALREPVEPHAWLPARSPHAPRLIDMPDLGGDEAFASESDAATEKLLRAVCNALIEAESSLDEMDAKVGDGDTGTTFAGGARAVIERLDDSGLPLATHSKLFNTIGQIVTTHMGGSSGVLLSILFTTAGNELADGQAIGPALDSGAAAMQRLGGAQPGDRTLLDSLLPALEALGDDQDLQAAAKKAREGADETSTMETAGAGRSSYLRSDSLSGHADPGATAVAIAFEAAAG